MGPPRLFRYADGSGNAFRFERRADGAYDFHYAPVRPAMSSSGFYSGGEERSGLIDAAEAAALWTRLRPLLTEPSVLLERRVMGSGLLVSQRRSGEEERWILARSGALEAFEAALERFRG